MKPPRPLDTLRERLDALLQAARHLDEGDIESVHRTRVASRRLRELLPVLRLDGDAASKLGRRLKQVTKRLGTVRELDVLIMTIHELEQDDRYSSAALKRVSAAVQRDRAAAREHLATKLGFRKIQRLARRLERAARAGASAHEQGQQRRTLRPERAWVWAVEARATRRAADARSAIEAAGTVYVPERLHAIRIALKKLRYTLELVAEARSLDRSRDVDALRAAQDLLGRLHDLEVLIDRTRQEQANPFPPTLDAWRELDLLVSALEGDCRVLHASYMSNRDTLIAIADRLSGRKKPPLQISRRAG